MADSNKPIVPGGDTVGTVGEFYLSKNGKTYECVAVIDNTTVTPNGETIPKVEYVWVCTDDGAGGGAFPFDVSDAEPITISRTKEDLIAAIDAGKTPIGYWRHTQSNGTVIRLFHFVKRFDVANGTNLTFYFSDKTSSGVLDIKADGTIKRTYQNNDGGGASGSVNFTFTITPTNGAGSQMLSATRAEMLAALDDGKTLLGYWTETRTILGTTDTIKHEFRLESVSGTGADRGLAFVNYEQFYKSTLYVNGNDTVSFVDKEVLPAPMTKTEAMTQSVGMDSDGRLWTEPGASGGGGVQSDWNQNDDTQPDYVKNRPFYTGDPVETILVEESTVSFSEGSGRIYQGKFSSTFSPTIGETYKVSWDGTVYECVCAPMQGAGIIGNASITGAGSDSGEPFCIIVPGAGEIMIGSTEASDSHTFSIRYAVPQVVQIDEKYLPDTVATKSEVEATQEVLDGVFSSVATFTFDKQTSGRDTFDFNGFDYYKISDFNPSPSDVISFKGTNENGKEYSEINTGKNFAEYGRFIIVASAGFCSLPVSETNTLSFTAPSAGLYAQYEANNPDFAAGTAEFTLKPSSENYIYITGLLLKSSTAYSTKKFRITVDDSGTLSATEVTDTTT